MRLKCQWCKKKIAWIRGGQWAYETTFKVKRASCEYLIKVDPICGYCLNKITENGVVVSDPEMDEVFNVKE